MGKITRRRYKWEFKKSIIRKLESGKNLAQISREKNLHPMSTELLSCLKSVDQDSTNGFNAL
ncbi:MAG: hypothetical protein Q7J35_04350 [Candidatus Methanoperedens sp.]|nr:hypothetical protein [Candidatus Methanoperedens sp.]